ncbi:hypothetical protein HDV00_007290 [Rhizophlyctis rosea]|nr:hypothetical protein HDV00_007290 [Rhizophlyctis rosea]
MSGELALPDDEYLLDEPGETYSPPPSPSNDTLTSSLETPASKRTLDREKTGVTPPEKKERADKTTSPSANSQPSPQSHMPFDDDFETDEYPDYQPNRRPHGLLNKPPRGGSNSTDCPFPGSPTSILNNFEGPSPPNTYPRRGFHPSTRGFNTRPRGYNSSARGYNTPPRSFHPPHRGNHTLLRGNEQEVKQPLPTYQDSAPTPAPTTTSSTPTIEPYHDFRAARRSSRTHRAQVPRKGLKNCLPRPAPIPSTGPRSTCCRSEAYAGVLLLGRQTPNHLPEIEDGTDQRQREQRIIREVTKAAEKAHHGLEWLESREGHDAAAAAEAAEKATSAVAGGLLSIETRFAGPLLGDEEGRARRRRMRRRMTEIVREMVPRNSSL